LLALIKESASFARQISLAPTIKRRHVAAQRETTIGVRRAKLGLADTFGVYFRWRPFKGKRAEHLAEITLSPMAQRG